MAPNLLGRPTKFHPAPLGPPRSTSSSPTCGLRESAPFSGRPMKTSGGMPGAGPPAYAHLSWWGWFAALGVEVVRGHPNLAEQLEELLVLLVGQHAQPEPAGLEVGRRRLHRLPASVGDHGQGAPTVLGVGDPLDEPLTGQPLD